MSEHDHGVDQSEIAARRRAALKHAIVLGLVSLGFLALFILRTTAGD